MVIFHSWEYGEFCDTIKAIPDIVLNLLYILSLQTELIQDNDDR